MSIIEQKFISSILRFNGADPADFHLWSLCVKTLLQARKLDEALKGKDVRSISFKQDLTVIVISLGDNLLSVIESCDSAKKAWYKLQM